MASVSKADPKTHNEVVEKGEGQAAAGDDD